MAEIHQDLGRDVFRKPTEEEQPQFDAGLVSGIELLEQAFFPVEKTDVNLIEAELDEALIAERVVGDMPSLIAPQELIERIVKQTLKHVTLPSDTYSVLRNRKTGEHLSRPVTQQYTLLENRYVFDAMLEAVHKLGVKLQIAQLWQNDRKSSCVAELRFPEFTTEVDGRKAMLVALYGNSYDTSRGLTMRGGAFTDYCLNLSVVHGVRLVDVSNRRHTGDLEGLVDGVVENLEVFLERGPHAMEEEFNCWFEPLPEKRVTLKEVNGSIREVEVDADPLDLFFDVWQEANLPWRGYLQEGRQWLQREHHNGSASWWSLFDAGTRALTHGGGAGLPQRFRMLSKFRNSLYDAMVEGYVPQLEDPAMRVAAGMQ